MERSSSSSSCDWYSLHRSNCCVIPGCCTVISEDIYHMTPYCTKYHEKLDIQRHYAANKGFYHVEGHWGPPWPNLLKSSFTDSKNDDNIWEKISNIPHSPEIGVNQEEEGTEESNMELFQLSPSPNIIPPLCRNISPKVEGNCDPHVVDPANDDGSWQTRIFIPKRKSEQLVLSITEQHHKRNRLERNSMNSTTSIQQESQSTTNKRKYQPTPTLSLQYTQRSLSSNIKNNIVNTKQLRIGEYFSKRDS